MTLDAKTLETALKAAAKVYASQDRREPPTPSDIEGTAEDLRSPINAFLALADLVPRVQMDNAVSKARMVAIEERDEARREAAGLQDKLDFAAEQWGKSDREVDRRGKQLAALREALEELETFPQWGGDTPADFTAFTKWVQGIAGKALTDTAAAAAQWVRVPEGRVIVSLSAAHGAVELGRDFYKNCRTSPCLYPDWLRELGVSVDNALPAAPQAGEPKGE